MKVLFVVNDESISTSIVKKYQKQYKEIISYKNVYYFNAIIKELQKNKTYDRIVISEDLDEIIGSNVYQKDKLLFDKLDNISDEAVNSNGEDIPIILICNDRRNKSEDILVKIFGIGIYNAIIGADRTADMVCELINKPRSKKEAKKYYKIDSDNVSYEKERDNYVSEVEIQNVLRHFKKISGDNKEITDSFKKIVSQYNNEQLKVIVAILPNDIKKVLEEASPEYQKIAIKKDTKQLSSPKNKGNKVIQGTSERLLEVEPSRKLSKQVVVPTTMERSLYKKVEKATNIEIEDEDIDDDIEEDIDEGIKNKVEKILEKQPKGAGRPKKRGRPRKNKEDNEELAFLPGLGDEEELENNEFARTDLKQNEKVKTNHQQFEDDDYEESFDNDDEDSYEDSIDEEEIVKNKPSKVAVKNNNKINQQQFDEEDDDYEESFGDDDEDSYEDSLDEEEIVRNKPSKVAVKNNNKIKINQQQFEDEEEDNEYEDSFDAEEIANNRLSNLALKNNKRFKLENQEENEKINSINDNFEKSIEKYDNKDSFRNEEFNTLITGDKKIVSFVGTSKNGTSFIVNNLAQVLSNMGINTAILDATKNKNSYYTYTNDDEKLRRIAFNSISNLIDGNANGIRINNNLTIYTGVPSKQDEINDSYAIIETLLKNHSIVLIDCDFETPIDYYDKSQEIYLIQSFDVLTIQPLTEFLRLLQLKNINFENKIRIILNKCVKIRGGSSKAIIKGMSKYNNEDLSLMKDLFNIDQVRVVAEIPFDEDVYIKYLESLISCDIKTNSYPKIFRQNLSNLASIIYPLLPTKNKKKQKGGYNSYSSSFSSDMNNTLNNMRKKY